MRLDDEAESANVQDRRGRAPLAIGGGGLAVLVVAALIAVFVFKIDPAKVLDVVLSQAGVQAPDSAAPQTPSTAAPRDPQAVFAAKVLRSTEEVWGKRFADVGRTYSPPTLVLYATATTTGCGFGQAAMGPFYCAQDRSVYLDLGFFQELKDRFGAPGDFARAYVIAHEVGHHVQNLLGITRQATEAEGAAQDRVDANKVSVKIELQADCFAGVWAKSFAASGRADPGDLDAALNAASAVGDDRLQKQTQGEVVPDSFTHGSSAQRQHWFQAGYQSGDPDACDTFGTGVGFAHPTSAGAPATP
jgi:predicted metalloprotease